MFYKCSNDSIRPLQHMSYNAPDGTRVATTVLEAAAWRVNVRLTCTCRHHAAHDPHGLWWHCKRWRWDDDFRSLYRRFFCSRCFAITRAKVRPALIDTCKGEPTIYLPPPPEREWKNVIRNFRS